MFPVFSYIFNELNNAGTIKTMEENIQFESEKYTLEGVFERGKGDRGAVITHPHPQYGGDMNNYVIKTIADVYKQKNISILKFNFRGVGKSQGSYDNGTGEQKDVISAVSYLLKRGVREIDLAGYSFGAWINAQAVNNGLQAHKMIMISPPVVYFDFTGFSSINNLKLIITGSEDDIAQPDIIKKMFPQWNQNICFKIIEGADHFYGGYLKQLEAVLSSCL